MPGSISLLVAAAAVCAAAGCDRADNYLDPDGPRYAGDHAGSPPPPRDDLRVVTYNLRYAEKVDAAIAALASAELRDADVILMQEMDAEACERVAAGHALRYVYYPGSVHDNGKDFGTAVLSRHPITADHKLILPHADPLNGRIRIATAATLDVHGAPLTVYSVHTSIITLGLDARLEQAEAVLDDAARAPGPVIVGGDFNTGDPGSVEQTIALHEARGFDWTSAGTDDTGERNGVYFLLDYVFGRGLPAHAAGVYLGEAGSDHRPVWAVVAAP